MMRVRPSMCATQLTDAYETLRAAVLSGHSHGQFGLAILIHRGLTAWISELKSQAPLPTQSPMVEQSPDPTVPVAAPNELTCVLAEIIMTLTIGEAPNHA